MTKPLEDDLCYECLSAETVHPGRVDRFPLTVQDALVILRSLAMVSTLIGPEARHTDTHAAKRSRVADEICALYGIDISGPFTLRTYYRVEALLLGKNAGR